jgi:ferredoxin, 2Fe-2S
MFERSVDDKNDGSDGRESKGQMEKTEAAIDVTIVDEDGERPVSLEPGVSLLNALQANGVPIGAVCGGQMSCGTCHVYLEDVGSVTLDSDEIDLLESTSVYRPGRSRLACQVKVTTALARQAIEIAPEF